ncbi:hypothetical protein QBC36DRAFT_33676 [Triangularia setosa]|uniref:BHLH domain-containing protein n=1 Tax=Triangularia setosa TaxID=2587417 RepID=A0AAN6W3Q3_9PEZI|nr:hypothetical protein QBC36DRAFT_33676 [Podospora setosa]
MEQTSRWIQSDPDQLPEGHFGHELPLELEHRSPTDSNRWTYGDGLNNDLGYHDHNLHHSISNPSDPLSYQQPVTDDRLPSPTYSHLGTSFSQGPSALEVRWVSNSPISPPAPYSGIACTLSSSSSAHASPILPSPGNSDHWPYRLFPINHTYGVSLSQPDSPVVSTDFDTPHSGRELPEPYFTRSIVSSTASPVDQELRTGALLPLATRLGIETMSTQNRQLDDGATSSDIQRVEKVSGKGQLPSPSTKAKTASRTKGTKAATPASSSSTQPQKQSKLSGPSLRTATRRFKRTTDETPPKPGESLEDQRARENHNQVEKEYRNRLHKGFEELLEALYALPVEELLIARHNIGAAGSVDGGHDNEEEHMAILGVLLNERAGFGLPASKGTGVKGKKKKQRRMSKAEVLHYTCRVLKSMGDGNQKLKEEVEELRSLHDMSMREHRK